MGYMTEGVMQIHRESVEYIINGAGTIGYLVE